MTHFGVRCFCRNCPEEYLKWLLQECVYQNAFSNIFGSKNELQIALSGIYFHTTKSIILFQIVKFENLIHEQFKFFLYPMEVHE